MTLTVSIMKNHLPEFFMMEHRRDTFSGTMNLLNHCNRLNKTRTLPLHRNNKEYKIPLCYFYKWEFKEESLHSQLIFLQILHTNLGIFRGNSFRFDI